MKITVLGINFFPERTGIAPYTTRIARHLAVNHSVSVFTGLPHYPDWRVDANWRRPSSLRDSDQLRVSHHGHYVPTKQSAARRIAYEATWSLNVARFAMRTPTDLVIAVVPPLFGSLVANAVGKRFSAPVGIIVQDVMSAAASQSGIAGGRTVAGVAVRLERWALQRADGVVTIHPKLATDLQQRFELGHTPRVIYNWTHLGASAAPVTGSGRGDFGWGDEVVVLHSGNMGLKQDLASVVRAGRAAQRTGGGIRFVLAGGGSQFRALASMAEGLDNVDVIDGVTDERFPHMLAAADVLLVNERPGMSSMSLPSKLTSYFTSGRPVIAASDDDSATSVFLNAAGAGIVIAPGDEVALVNAVRYLAADVSLSERLGRKGREFAESQLREDTALASYSSWVEDLVAATSQRSR